MPFLSPCAETIMTVVAFSKEHAAVSFHEIEEQSWKPQALIASWQLPRQPSSKIRITIRLKPRSFMIQIMMDYDLTENPRNFTWRHGGNSGGPKCLVSGTLGILTWFDCDNTQRLSLPQLHKPLGACPEYASSLEFRALCESKQARLTNDISQCYWWEMHNQPMYIYIYKSNK